MIKPEKQNRQAEMFALIDQWQQSGQSQQLFCSQSGVAKSIFYYWLKKYRMMQQDIAGFIPVNIRSTNQHFKHTIEVQYPNGVSLRLSGIAGVSVLKALINLA